MASDERSGARPEPVVLRIKLRYDDVDAMVQRFAANVGKSGLFLPTKSLQPIGCEIKFELRLADGTPVLVGLGRVKAVREPDPQNPRAAFGLAVELMRVTPQSRELILKMLERRRQLGLPETALPMPADIDAARRADLVDTGVASAPVPVAIPAVDSAPQVFTAPRRQSGPVAVAKTLAIEPLAPEAPRRKRPAIAEVIERASGPIAIVADLEHDVDVDVGAALTRARVLAGSDLDGELAALREAAAAPLVEITVEAASAELARQLGGAAVRRDRSQRWAPPPAVAEPVPAVIAEPAAVAAESAASAELSAVAIDAAASAAPSAVAIEAAAVAEPVPVAEPAAQAIRDIEAAGEPPVVAEPAAEARVDAEPAVIPAVSAAPLPAIAEPEVDPEAELAFDRPRTEPALPEQVIAESDAEPEVHEVDPAQISDEIHQLADDDFEEVEQTQIGALPVDPDAFDAHAYATVPAAEQEQLADQLDAELAAAEAEADADDLGLASAELAVAAASAAIDEALRLDGEAYEQRALGTDDDFVMPVGMPEAADAIPDDGGVDPGDSGELEEIEDFEILAEADAGDEDLLVTPRPELQGDDELAIPHAPMQRPSFLDFAARLDLDDERELHAPAPPLTLDDDDGVPRPLSINQALASLDEADDGDDFDAPHGNYRSVAAAPGFIPPDAFDQSDVIAIAPVRAYDSAPVRAEADEDLETALEALDVDLDDLSLAPQGTARIPEGDPRVLDLSGRTRTIDVATARRPVRQSTLSPPTEPSRARRGAHQRAPRATTEDGILIDFDEDDE